MQTDDSKGYGSTSSHSRATTLAADTSTDSTQTYNGLNRSYRPPRDNERSWLLASRATNDPGTSLGAGPGSGSAAGAAMPNRRRSTWLFNPGQQQHGESLLPTTSVRRTASASDLMRRSKELPGQT
ncbi:hypothetical protein BGZ58_010934 [Dissophora ornata]|nr:hypothetical protein BGZ58_010934 [Dissophora ornata]